MWMLSDARRRCKSAVHARFYFRWIAPVSAIGRLMMTRRCWPHGEKQQTIFRASQGEKLSIKRGNGLSEQLPFTGGAARPPDWGKHLLRDLPVSGCQKAKPITANCNGSTQTTSKVERRVISKIKLNAQHITSGTLNYQAHAVLPPVLARRVDIFPTAFFSGCRPQS